MTIGKKIAHLRTAAGLSQEQLAEALGVSRQSVSKWEMNQAQPQIDKVLLISDIFHITTDEFLRGSTEPKSRTVEEPIAGKYFGTDGFRGEANVSPTSAQAYRIGRFLSWYFASPLSGCNKPGYRPRLVVGKDTRRSSYMLEYALVAGIVSSGADAYMLHVTTTPSVPYVTRQEGFDCGIMITASHNPYYDNGIKIFNAYGEKIDDRTIALLEAYIDRDMGALGIPTGDDLPLARRERIGCIFDYVSGRNRYIGYLISVASNSYRKLRIGLDCANGASWNIARAVFGALGAQLTVINAEPDGLNVNRDCGSTHPQALCQLVREQHLDMGFAFDGDADRCIAVDENGQVVNGDAILYVLARRLKNREMLENDTIVTTVMSNSGLAACLKKIGIRCEQTAVGDRFVYDCMQEHGYSLGGEPTGHIILKKYASTGDALLTAIMIAEEVCDTKHSLAELSEEVCLRPSVIRNVRVQDKAAAIADPRITEVAERINTALDGSGRILLRPSGTESLIRILVEGDTVRQCEAYAETVYNVLCEAGYVLGEETQIKIN